MKIEVGRVAEVVDAGHKFWVSAEFYDSRFVRFSDKLEKVLVLDCSHSAFAKVLLREGGCWIYQQELSRGGKPPMSIEPGFLVTPAFEDFLEVWENCSYEDTNSVGQLKPGETAFTLEVVGNEWAKVLISSGAAGYIYIQFLELRKVIP